MQTKQIYLYDVHVDGHYMSVLVHMYTYSIRLRAHTYFRHVNIHTCICISLYKYACSVSIKLTQAFLFAFPQNSHAPTKKTRNAAVHPSGFRTPGAFPITLRHSKHPRIVASQQSEASPQFSHCWCSHHGCDQSYLDVHLGYWDMTSEVSFKLPSVMHVQVGCPGSRLVTWLLAARRG